MSSCDKIVDSNPPLKEFCSHGSQVRQKAYVLICALTLALKCCSTLLYGYQKEASLTLVVVGMVFKTNQVIISRSGKTVREREEIFPD